MYWILLNILKVPLKNTAVTIKLDLQGKTLTTVWSLK